MKKHILYAVLMIISMQGKLYAQGNYLTQHSRTDRLFNIYPPIVNHIHTAHLLKNEKMIVELADLTDYDILNNLDSVLRALMNDIEFYKDSLPVTGNVRIDYAVAEGSGQTMVRFKKYAPEGDLFVKQHNETSRLKLDQDTVHIILKKKPFDRSDRAHFYDFPVQVTFCLNNYTDLDTLLNRKGLITAVVDTMAKAITPKKNNPEHGFPYNSYSQSTVEYYPYATENKLEKTNIIMASSGLKPDGTVKKHSIKVNAKIGAGLVRNELSPIADVGVQYNTYWGWGKPDVSIFRVSATPYYFFDRDQHNNFTVNDNWFVNASIGSIYDNIDPEWVGNEHTIGVGYLVFEKGGYFKGPTFKIFTDLQIINRITIVPEVIVTDNFKQIFPGITLKIF